MAIHDYIFEVGMKVKWYNEIRVKCGLRLLSEDTVFEVTGVRKSGDPDEHPQCIGIRYVSGTQDFKEISGIIYRTALFRPLETSPTKKDNQFYMGYST